MNRGDVGRAGWEGLVCLGEVEGIVPMIGYVGCFAGESAGEEVLAVVDVIVKIEVSGNNYTGGREFVCVVFDGVDHLAGAGIGVRRV